MFDLNEILKAHMEWLEDNTQCKRADLSGANLNGVDLRNVNLSWGNLSEINLCGAKLSKTNLYNANLIRSNLVGIDLFEADLRGADLIGADLSGAELGHANLNEADIRGANLENVNLRGANLNKIKSDVKFIQIGCIGSRNGTTIYCFEMDKIWCGCFKGTLDGFENRVEITHKYNPQFLKEYRSTIEYIRKLKEVM